VRSDPAHEIVRRRSNFTVNKPSETPAFNAAFPKDCTRNDCMTYLKGAGVRVYTGRGERIFIAKSGIPSRGQSLRRE
jgi:hypothetical protein